MPGKILRVLTSVGASVKKGELLLVLEAMKMENEIFAEVDGTVTQLRVRDGDTVNSGDVLAVIG
jgi:glutaconyl-CoA decarboxylase